MHNPQPTSSNPHGVTFLTAGESTIMGMVIVSFLAIGPRLSGGAYVKLLQLAAQMHDCTPAEVMTMVKSAREREASRGQKT
jgi:hypothetical protein